MFNNANGAPLHLPVPVRVDGGELSPAAFNARLNNGTHAGETTRVHNYPLPPEGREYRPTYSRGRYALTNPHTGKPDTFTRVTTGAHSLDSTEGLDGWKTGNVVLGLKDNPDLLEDLDLYADPADVRRQVRRIADKAQEAAGANQAAELGTAIHAWTEAVERDGVALEDVPDLFQPYVRAYLEALADYGITTVPDMVERIVYNSGTGWVGTLDRIYRLADGTHVIGDVKTSKTLRYGWLGFSVQFACYADATHMLRLDGSGWDLMPPVSRDYAVVAHLPSNQPGVCELATFDLHAGREHLDLAVQVYRARQEAEKRVARKWDIPVPTSTQDELVAKIKAARTSQDLSELWAANAAVWTPELTELGMDIIAKHAAGQGQ